MLHPFKEFFHYSRGERRGALGLLLIVLVLIIWYFIRGFFVSESTTDFSEFKEQISQFNNETLNPDSGKEDTIQYFMFNPNDIGIDEWIAMGFSEKQASSIENYKASGAVFKIKKDVLKLFMVDEIKYASLEPYIDLPESFEQSYKTNSLEENKANYIVLLKKSMIPLYTGFEGMDSIFYTKKDLTYWYCKLPFSSRELANEFIDKGHFSNAIVYEETNLKGYYPIHQEVKSKISPKLNVIVSINSADTTEFSQLTGIGNGYAKRIIKYRESLGGFVSIDQMKEVYMLPPEIINNNKDYFKLDTSLISKININIVDVNMLRLHPYIKWNVANSIVQMRNIHGNYKNVSDIKKSDLINEDLFLKIAPYLSTK